MFRFNHVAITTSNLEDSIKFYEKLGFKLQSHFNKSNDKWAVLKIGEIGLEIFECKNKKIENDTSHFALSTDDIMKSKQKIESLTNQKLNIYYGDLNKASFHFNDLDGNDIQIISLK